MPPRTPRRNRSLGILPLVLGASLSLLGSAAAREPTVIERRIVSDGRHLLLDLRMRDLFTVRARNAIEAGLTTSLAYELRLSPGRRRAVEREIVFEIRHDIWEGRYLVLRKASPPDTLRGTEFDSVEAFCSEVRSLELAPADLLSSEEILGIRMRARIETVSPEQASRTRKWLETSPDESEDNPSGAVRIDFGDLIRFFLDFYKPQERSGWIDLGRYRGRPPAGFLPEEVR